MTRWAIGETTIQQMLSAGHLESVAASRSQADFLVKQARTHLASATAIADADPTGAYQLTYDATRKALVAVLENQGLRPTHAGGHVVVGDAVAAQLGNVAGNLLRAFPRMRRTRNDSEYPTGDAPSVTAHDVKADLARATDIVDMAEQVLDQMGAF
ncbi:hypothetical protein [Nocardioides sp. URHA0020]|uniref:hypothetical protein n=1 Tax=Nocardioides sp. URHA0020 TaxID=1380392 RepID=UPI00048D8BE5|nr:hypothetical protein [Nocardioides sp. URHA0020]